MRRRKAIDDFRAEVESMKIEAFAGVVPSSPKTPFVGFSIRGVEYNEAYGGLSENKIVILYAMNDKTFNGAEEMEAELFEKLVRNKKRFGGNAGQLNTNYVSEPLNLHVFERDILWKL